MVRIRRNLDKKWVFYGVVSVLYTIALMPIIMYSIFLIQLILYIASGEKERNQELIDLLLISIIIPNNYIIISVVFLSYIICKGYKEYNKKKNLLYAASLTLLIILNIVINKLYFPSIVLSIVYYFPFILSCDLCSRVFKNEKTFFVMVESTKKMIALEAVSTLAFYIYHYNLVRQYTDMDWVTGTFGQYQCNVLMCVSALSILIFWKEYRHNNKGMYWMLISGVMALLTGAVSYTLVFVFAVFLVVFFTIKASVIRKLSFLVLIAMAVVLFVCVMPDWMTRDIVSMTNKNYVLNRVTKLHYYYNTFCDIPTKEGMSKFLFGTGIGQYSSRSAETVAGGYVGLYDKLSLNYESYYRKTYINIYYGGNGLLSTSASSIISLQGELGIFGLISVLLFFLLKYRKTKDISSKVALLFILGLMFVDNVLEFSKYSLMLWMIYYSIENTEKKNS